MGIEYIAWQRELIASLKEDGHWELARQAQAVLDQMIGMPNGRVPPFAFGISTRRTGGGK
jgi:hypothetical protein